MKHLLSFLVIGLLTGCASSGEKGITPAEAALGSCQTYTRLLNSATESINSGLIGGPDIFVVIDEANRITEPYCGGSTPPAVEDSVAKIAIEAGSKMLLPLALTIIQ